MLGPKAGRAQRLGAVGDELSAINSVMMGSLLNGLAFGFWGGSNWLYGGLSNKAAAAAAAVVKKAFKENLSLKQAALDLQLLTAEQFDAAVKPEEMAFPNPK